MILYDFFDYYDLMVREIIAIKKIIRIIVPTING
jgi:hypothetical protein